MKRRPEAALLALAAAAAGLACVEAAALDTDWIDFEKVRAGEVVYRTGKADALTATVDVALEIDAAPETIWRVLTACEVSPEYVPHVQRCERIETVDGGRAELFVQEVKPAFFLPSFEHVFRLDYEPYEHIDVSRVSGPLNHMHGTWDLIEQESGTTLLVHSFAVDPGMPIPRFIVRARLRNDMPEVLKVVRERAERRAEID